MVQYIDHSVVAQLGTPDMRGPIAYGLAWPDRVSCGAASLDFGSMGALTFESISEATHQERFPGLTLAWDVLKAPAGATSVLNAANEVGVAAFLERRIRFDQIHHVNVDTLSELSFHPPKSLQDLLDLDNRARQTAESLIQRRFS
jgi:1-deoxy-D-xylulose-5-phosphate reductoisomerase